MPKSWQYDRFIQLATELNKVEKDFTIIAGDLLDVAKPSLEEVGLMYEFLAKLEGKKIIIPGNHEMVNKSTDCYHPITSMLDSLNCIIVREFETIYGIDFIPYNILKSDWPTARSPLCITHVRGEIPPHVTPEIDLSKYKTYEKVFAGDLHSVTNSQLNILYPGSPFVTSFHKEVTTGANGYILLDTKTKEHEWVELTLPQLVRKRVSSADEMVATDYHHTIYELEGSMEELSKVQSTELLDKKVAQIKTQLATLEMSGDVSEELFAYLTKVVNMEESLAKQHVSLWEDLND